MGFLGLELFEKKTKISNEIPVNDNRSSGFHLLEIHLPSIGLGAVTLGLLILAAVVIYYLAYRYRAMSRRPRNGLGMFHRSQRPSIYEPPRYDDPLDEIALQPIYRTPTIAHPLAITNARRLPAPRQLSAPVYDAKGYSATRAEIIDF